MGQFNENIFLDTLLVKDGHDRAIKPTLGLVYFGQVPNCTIVLIKRLINSSIIPTSVQVC